MFLKLYLISKNQFTDILKKNFNLDFDEKDLYKNYTKQGK